nr:MAG TPA: hypothetical protein [Caudoviricetes sp.]
MRFSCLALPPVEVIEWVWLPLLLVKPIHAPAFEPYNSKFS